MARTPRMSLSSYAFNNYGSDAALYNGIADLEAVSKALAGALQQAIERAERHSFSGECPENWAEALAAYREQAALASSEVGRDHTGASQGGRD